MIPTVLMMAIALFIISAQTMFRVERWQFASYEHAYFMLTLSIFKTRGRSLLILGIFVILLGVFCMLVAAADLVEELFMIGMIIFIVGIISMAVSGIDGRYQNNVLARTPPWGPFVQQNIRSDRQALLSRLLGHLGNLALISRWIVAVASLLIFWGIGEFVYFATVYDIYYYDNDPLIYLYVPVLKIILGIILFTSTNLIMIRPLKSYKFWHGMLGKG